MARSQVGLYKRSDSDREFFSPTSVMLFSIHIMTSACSNRSHPLWAQIPTEHASRHILGLVTHSARHRPEGTLIFSSKLMEPKLFSQLFSVRVDEKDHLNISCFSHLTRFCIQLERSTRGALIHSHHARVAFCRRFKSSPKSFVVCQNPPYRKCERKRSSIIRSTPVLCILYRLPALSRSIEHPAEGDPDGTFQGSYNLEIASPAHWP